MFTKRVICQVNGVTNKQSLNLSSWSNKAVFLFDMGHLISLKINRQLMVTTWKKLWWSSQHYLDEYGIGSFIGSKRTILVLAMQRRFANCERIFMVKIQNETNFLLKARWMKENLKEWYTKLELIQNCCCNP